MKIVRSPIHIKRQTSTERACAQRSLEDLTAILSRENEIMNGRYHADFFLKQRHFLPFIEQIHGMSLVPELIGANRSSIISCDAEKILAESHCLEGLSTLDSTYVALTAAEVIMDYDVALALTKSVSRTSEAGSPREQDVLNNPIIAANYFRSYGYTVGIVDIARNASFGLRQLASTHRILLASIHSGSQEDEFRVPLQKEFPYGESGSDRFFEALSAALDYCKDVEVLVIPLDFSTVQPAKMVADHDSYKKLGSILAGTKQRKLILSECSAETIADYSMGILTTLRAMESTTSGARTIGISIIYHSETCHTRHLADLVAQGCSEVNHINTRVMPVNEIDKKFLRSSKALVFGCPTQYGTVSWQMKQFLDTYFENMGIFLEGKLGGAFSTASWLGGGSETTVHAMHASMLCYGMMIYSGGSYKGRPYNHFGAVALESPEGLDKEKAIKFGRDIALQTLHIFGRC